MSATDQGADVSAADVYRGFIDAVNRQDLEEAARFVDPARYLSVAQPGAQRHGSPVPRTRDRCEHGDNDPWTSQQP